MDILDKFTPEFLRECFEYDENTGALLWKERPASHFKNIRAYNIWKSRFPGKVAGGTNTQPCGYTYRVVRLNNVLLRVHRVAWKYVYGVSPETELDHKDRNSMNNAIANLRECLGEFHNKKNLSRRKDNSSGVTGLWWDAKRGKWQVRVQVSGKTIHVGRFKEKLDAENAVKATRQKHNFDPTHGQ